MQAACLRKQVALALHDEDRRPGLG
jgi:hypothetical protein